MARNDERRSALADAGIRVLAEQGARGLTHRAVDEAAVTPRGTASNYFATRDDLIAALVDRIGQRLTPPPAVSPENESPGERTAGDRRRFATYLRDVVRRLSTDPHVALALFELRLESTRRPGVAATLQAWRQQAFDADVTFNQAADLPGGRAEIALFHHAIDGLMLDHLTTPLDTGLTTDEALDTFVERLLPNRPEVVCLCGSMRFADQMRLHARGMTREGFIVLAPEELGSDDVLTEELKAELDELHRRKIDSADRVVVVNPGGYIGDSTASEIAHARALGKPISFTHPRDGE